MSTFNVITQGLRFPEGPVALPDGTILLVEIAAGCLTRVAMDGTTQRVAEPGGGPNGAAVGPQGLIYVCNNGGFNWHEEAGLLRPIGQADDYSGGRIERIDIATGAVEVLYTHCDGHALRGPNDLVFDDQGGFYFTDLGKVRERDMDRGGVYYAAADGSAINQVAFPVLTPNGVGLSPAGDYLYVAETETGRLWKWRVLEPGVLEQQPWPSPHGGVLVVGLSGFQRFDSLAVDSAGNICVATLMNGGITVISADGRQVEHHAFPDRYCTNICFAGENMDTAIITLSGSGRLVSCAWPTPGLRLHDH